MKYIFFMLLLNIFAAIDALPPIKKPQLCKSRKQNRQIIKIRHYACLLSRIKKLEDQVLLLEQQKRTVITNYIKNINPEESYIPKHNMHYGNTAHE